MSTAGMLAKRLPSVLPQLNAAESLETTRIYSAVGKLRAGQSLVTERPFRAPHHSISDVGLVGGGRIPMPGEISLTHNGFLFMDGLPDSLYHGTCSKVSDILFLALRCVLSFSINWELSKHDAKTMPPVLSWKAPPSDAGAFMHLGNGKQRICCHGFRCRKSSSSPLDRSQVSGNS